MNTYRYFWISCQQTALRIVLVDGMPLPPELRAGLELGEMTELTPGQYLVMASSLGADWISREAPELEEVAKVPSVRTLLKFRRDMAGRAK